MLKKQLINGLEGNWSPNYEEDTSQWAAAMFLMFLMLRTKNRQEVGLLWERQGKPLSRLVFDLEDSRKLGDEDGFSTGLTPGHVPCTSQSPSHSWDKSQFNR